MRKKIVAGNWKMNTVVEEGVELASKVVSMAAEVPSDVTLVVAPPFTHLVSVAQALKDSAVGLSAQNCADRSSGAFTGEVSARMLKSASCSFVILGHSERRQYYGETDQILSQKLALAMEEGLVPIFCVGETLSEREQGRHFEVVASQIRNVLFALEPQDMAKVIIAYEPVWAIGTGKTASAEQAQEIHAHIRSVISEKYGELSQQISILYGGSCKPSNAKELFACKDIDGGLIGGAALKAEDFIAIAKSF